ncbi:MAG: hypothetical protein V7K83_22450 [Nostoc sp.]
MFIYGLLMLLPANGFTGQCCDRSLRDIDGEGDGYFFADELFVDQADSTPSKVHLACSILLPRIANNQTATSNKSETSMTLPSNPININYLQPFDTAVIAYHMMGIGNFE